MTLKITLLKTGVIALGLGIGIGLIVVVGFVYMSLPKGWNKKAITATFNSSDFNRKPSPAVYYTYTLTNNSNTDFSTKLIGDKHLSCKWLHLAAERSLLEPQAIAKP